MSMSKLREDLRESIQETTSGRVGQLARAMGRGEYALGVFHGLAGTLKLLDQNSLEEPDDADYEAVCELSTAAHDRYDEAEVGSTAKSFYHGQMASLSDVKKLLRGGR